MLANVFVIAQVIFMIYLVDIDGIDVYPLDAFAGDNRAAGHNNRPRGVVQDALSILPDS